MPLDLLDAPLRVTWDLHGPHGAAPAAVARSVAARLTEAGVFFVALGARPLAHPDAADLFSRLRAGGCRLSLGCSGDVEELAALAAVVAVDTVLIEAAPFFQADGIDTTALAGVLASLRDRGCTPGLQLVPTRTTLPRLPALLDFCRAHGVTEVKLSNTPVPAVVTPAWQGELLDPVALADFRAALGPDPASVVRGLTLEIHDLFLWEILQSPGGSAARGEYGGCQAGNSLAHIDAAGDLYPCASWPQPLGSLVTSTLEELWATPARLALRDEVAGVPCGCRDCRDYPSCFGGCRGLSRTVAPAASGRDLLCAAPRRG